jgi:hypothetical protein
VCRIAVDPNHFDGDSMRGMSWFQEATAKEFTSDGFFRYVGASSGHGLAEMG